MTAQQRIAMLFQLSLAPEKGMEESLRAIAAATAEERAELIRTADSHHVVLRALLPLRDAADKAVVTDVLAWSEQAIAVENARISNALNHLDTICRELEDAGCPITVMKSLDHWPDIGNDLDLYTPAAAPKVREAMLEQLNAWPKGRTWGDRLAQKHSFGVPDLRESVEIHHDCLGQTGEHIALARRFWSRRVPLTLQGHTFMIPAAEERVIAATLQRMYRHFYIRVCDVANTTALLESGELDFEELKNAADIGGIWPGVATYLRVVAEFTRRYRGTAPQLPQGVLDASMFGVDETFVRGIWIRVPVNRAANLYSRQMGSMLRRFDGHGAFRLSLLPPLASIARVTYKLTGDHRGIW